MSLLLCAALCLATAIPASAAPPALSVHMPGQSALAADPSNTTTVSPHTTATEVPTESIPGELKTGIMAGGWIPFAVILLISCFVSFWYIRYYQHKREREAFSSAVAMVGLIVALLTTAMIPVDIFLVSSFKGPDGTFHSWASESVRSQVLTTITDGYYAMYSLVCVFVFALMPLAYFYFEEKDEVAGTSSVKRLLHALKFTCGTLIVMGVLMCIGAFALNTDGTQCNALGEGNTTVKDWAQCRADFAEQSLTASNGANAISFTVGALSVIGMLYFIMYTAFGMVFLPVDLMRARQTVSDLEIETTVTSSRPQSKKADALRAKYSNRKNKKMSDRDMDQLADIEDDERAISQAQRQLQLDDKTWIAKVARTCRPFSLIIGIALMLLSFFLVVCLFMTSIDKLLQITSEHLNYKYGYSQASPRILNPVDQFLNVLQIAFPMDYIGLTLLIYYMVLCTAGGVVRQGIRFCFLKVFRVRSGNTVPQGLLCLVAILMFTVLALNIVLLSLAPQYSTYGNQRYPVLTNANYSAYPSPSTKMCDLSAPGYIYYAYNSSVKYQLNGDYSAPNGQCQSVHIQNSDGGSIDLSVLACSKEKSCVSSRLAALLHAFFYNAWFFGAIYYWANWFFIVVFFLSFIWALVKKRESALQSAIKEQKTNFDEDDDIVPFNPSWMKN